MAHEISCAIEAKPDSRLARGRDDASILAVRGEHTTGAGGCGLSPAWNPAGLMVKV